MAAARNMHLAVCFMGGIGYVIQNTKLCSFTMCIEVLSMLRITNDVSQFSTSSTFVVIKLQLFLHRNFDKRISFLSSYQNLRVMRSHSMRGARS